MRIDYPTGAFYRGETTQTGNPHGWGDILYPSNTVIAGRWVNGLVSGKGITMSNEMLYKGDWKDHQFHGKGKMIYKDDGEQYEGEFADNEKCGHGKVSWPSGSSYSGDWKHDMPNGTGILNAQGKIYIGQWTDGCANNDTIVIRRL